EVLVSEEEFGDLFRRYAPYVATIGLRLLGRDDELDDLVQEVFIEAHRGLHQLRSAESVKAWLARITVRRASPPAPRPRARAVVLQPRFAAAGHQADRRGRDAGGEGGSRLQLPDDRADPRAPAGRLGAQAHRGRDAGCDRRDLPLLEGDGAAAAARRRAHP